MDPSGPDHDAMEVLHEQYFGEHMHEATEIRNLPSILGDSKRFLDIGSSLGQYAYFAGRSITDGDIYCVEPDPTKVEVLTRQLGAWEGETGNRYHLLSLALSDESGTIPFYVPKD